MTTGPEHEDPQDLSEQTPPPRQTQESEEVFTSAQLNVAPKPQDNPLAEENHEDDAENLPGDLDKTILGRYQILDILGRGAFSVVYRATQAGVGRTVALKVFLLHPASRKNPKLAEAALVRFQREARLASTLRHPNTITLYDYDKTDTNIFYMAFEHVEGPTLSREIKASPNGMPIERAIHIARQVAQSLEEAHESGIIHRDLKPGNVMLTRRMGDDDYVKVLDFGIAKLVEGSEDDLVPGEDNTDCLDILDLTGLDAENLELTLDGRIVGTPRYIPPEQIQGQNLSPASDIYALGLILHEMIVGVPANPGNQAQDLIRWHLDDLPFQLPKGFKYPAGAAYVIQKATHKTQKERYQSCQELLEDLDKLDNKGEWIKEPGGKRALFWGIALNAAILVALGAVVYSIQTQKPPQPPEVVALSPTPAPAKTETAQPTPPKDELVLPKEDPPAPPPLPSEPPIPEPVQLELTSKPENTEVFMGDLKIGHTPMKLALEEGQEEITITFKKKGYAPRNLTWRADLEKSVFPVVLKRPRSRPKKQPSAKPKPPQYHIIP